MKAFLFCICMCLVLEACLAKPSGKQKDGIKMPSNGHKNYKDMMEELKHYGIHPGMLLESPYIDPSLFGAEANKMKPQKPAKRRKTKRFTKSKRQTKRNAQKSN